MVRQGLGRLGHILMQRCVVRCEVNSRDIGYQWLLQWLMRQTPGQARQISLQGGGSSIVPSPGVHWLSWTGRWFRVERTRENASTSIGSTTGSPFESVQLSTLGTDPQIFVQMMALARAEAMAQERGKTVIYTSWGSEWRPFGAPRRKRCIDSVVLDSGVSESLISDVQVCN